MKILVAESRDFSASAVALLGRLGDVVLEDLDQNGLVSAAREADILLVRLRNRIDAQVLDMAPGLKAVVSPTTGLDHVDVTELDRRGVALLSLRGETGFLRTVTATAEHTWALLLALLRRIPEASASARSGVWDRDRFRGRELSGKTLGVVGVGRLGEMVARYGRAFGMEVLGYDPHLEAWPEGVSPTPDLHTLLAVSDVVSLHVPLTEDTRGMVDATALAAMRTGAILVNTSRGDLVDEGALVEAVASGRLAGAALDVVHGEAGPEGVTASPAMAFAARDPRILVTPHVGGATFESMEKTEIFMAEKLARWLRGETVSVDAGPSSASVPPSSDSTAS